MITTIYTCDRCKKEVEKEDLEGVAFGLRYYRQYSQDYVVFPRHVPGREFDWCKSCRIETGLTPVDAKLPDAKPLNPQPTLEDLIRELIRQELPT